MASLKIGNGLPVIGQGPGRGVSSPPMVGYLGKTHDSTRTTVGEYCPACREKGKFKVLKTYRISFQESIFLCEDLQCIYPLGTTPLSRARGSDWEDQPSADKPRKRRHSAAGCPGSPLGTEPKRPRSQDATDGRARTLSSSRDGEADDGVARRSPAPLEHDSHSPSRPVGSSEEQGLLETDTVDLPPEDHPPTVDVSRTQGAEGCTSEPEVPLAPGGPPSRRAGLVQWKNAYALCWLDCILSALVHLRGLAPVLAGQGCSRESLFWQLFTKYSEADELLRTTQPHLEGRKGGNGETLPAEVSAKIEACLNAARDAIFTRLQPQLRCTLGDMDSPVFALPLLLKLEPPVESLFACSFSWDFACAQCGHTYRHRCMKTLVTFTRVVPEWHPLNAAHFGPCNNCSDKSQIRRMTLEKLSPVFMVHFVEGLPHGDLQQYAFHFAGTLYRATSVIQYRANSHFITWILDADGSWLECDDLKGPCSERRERFEVPASEIHIVIWEREPSPTPANATASLPLTETNDRDTLGSQNQTLSPVGPVGSPIAAPGSPVTQPALGSGGAPKDPALSGPQGLAGSHILALTLDELEAGSECFPLENKPEGEDQPALAARLSPSLSLDSLLDSLVAAPCAEKPVQAQTLDVRLPSPGPGASLPPGPPGTQDAFPAAPGHTGPAAAPQQGEGPGESQAGAQLAHRSPPGAEALKPEPHVPSQASGAGPGSARPGAKQPVYEVQKKPFVGSWVQGLLSRGVSFMPPCVSAQARTALTGLQPSVKGARNFGGFKTKAGSQKASRASKKAHKWASKPPELPSQPASGGTASLPCPIGTADLGPQRMGGSASPGKDRGFSAAALGETREGQIHQLRLKLLKKLRAKKKKLAALTSSPASSSSSPPSGMPPRDPLENTSHCGSPSDCDSIEQLLNELQYQIDIADSSAGGPPLPSASPLSGQTQEEILAELLCPAVVASPALPEPGEVDFQYLEMGDNHVPVPVPAPSELGLSPQNSHPRGDHNYCSPTKKDLDGGQASPWASHTCAQALDLDSPVKTDIFDEFFSTSALNALTGDPLDLPHFDEDLFESC
ncbi:SUMO-specific isopeptidase USPL1 [Echinops telfairi]|uniref:SUMO-specific isopeptidase USPL1 n=1 Tax=Echinops telfairi TaxID=9371 RepID=A0ABM0J4X3_ECHTE|nr:SUMO-specific isopeptidase USPL1 [Echinops telfairi]